MPIENKYLHNGAFLTEDELHTDGILLTETTPDKHAVYGKGDRSGQTGTIYVGTRNSHKLHAEFWVKTEEGKFYANRILITKDSGDDPWRKDAESVGLVGYMDVYFDDDPEGAWDMDSGIGNATLKENFEAVKWNTIDGQNETYNNKPVTDAGWEYYIDGELVDNPDDYEPTCLLGDMETLYFYHNQMNSTIDVNGSVDAMVSVDGEFLYYPTLRDAYAEWTTEEPEIIGYTNTNGSLTETVRVWSGTLNIYNESGNKVQYESGKTYTLLKTTTNGTWNDTTVFEMTNNSGYLCIKHTGAYQTWVAAIKYRIT